MLNVEIAVAKVPKYAVQESGDTVEVVERPRGGISVVMADGQSSGRGAKIISNLAVRKAVSLLAEGVRDGAAARAAHDYLRTHRAGKVSAELVMVSVDLESRSLVITRNTRCPVLLGEGEQWRSIEEPADVVGIYERTRPAITELPLAAGQVVVAFSDGLLHAGRRRGLSIDLMKTACELAGRPGGTARDVAQGLLAAALELDESRPADDISVVVLCVTDVANAGPLEVRHMEVTFPVSPI